jgi:uncharacterized protein YdbL (DUF1318 family)
MKTQTRILFFLIIALVTASPLLLAAKYDIKQMTPEIERALSNRQNRYEQLQSLKASGAIGENSAGYIETLQPSSGASNLVAEENADRTVIYSAIVEQNGLGAAGLPQVQAVFADVQREKARSGDSIQLPSGEWTKK